MPAALFSTARYSSSHTKSSGASMGCAGFSPRPSSIRAASMSPGRRTSLLRARCPLSSSPPSRNFRDERWEAAMCPSRSSTERTVRPAMASSILISSIFMDPL